MEFLKNSYKEKMKRGIRRGTEGGVRNYSRNPPRHRTPIAGVEDSYRRLRPKERPLGPPLPPLFLWPREW